MGAASATHRRLTRRTTPVLVLVANGGCAATRRAETRFHFRTLNGESNRIPVYRAAVASGQLPAGCAIDDGAALLYTGTRLGECVRSRSGARVVRVSP